MTKSLIAIRILSQRMIRKTYIEKRHKYDDAIAENEVEEEMYNYLNISGDFPYEQICYTLYL